MNSVIPCPNPEGCNWPACPLDCKWRPGREDVHYWPPGSNWRTATCTVSDLELEQMEREAMKNRIYKMQPIEDEAMTRVPWEDAMEQEERRLLAERDELRAEVERLTAELAIERVVAAEAIERLTTLRAEVESLKEQVETCRELRKYDRAKIERLQVENEQLRQANVDWARRLYEVVKDVRSDLEPKP